MEKVLAESNRTLAKYDGELNRVLFLAALRLWQTWQRDAPVSAGRRDLVYWLFVDISQTATAKEKSLPHSYTRICETFRLWNLIPASLSIPLVCARIDPTFRLHLNAPIRLHDLGQRLPTDSVGNQIDTVVGEVVVLATVLDYVAVVHGREQISALFSALSHHHNWDTLIPAVFGMSIEEFEAGWHRHLAEEYGVSLP